MSMTTTFDSIKRLGPAKAVVVVVVVLMGVAIPMEVMLLMHLKGVEQITYRQKGL
jgi:hypothetical protein